MMRLVREHFRESKGVEPWLQVPPLDVPENWWFYCFWSLSLGQANPELCWWCMVYGCFFGQDLMGYFGGILNSPSGEDDGGLPSYLEIGPDSCNLDPKHGFFARCLGCYNKKDEKAAYVSTHGAHGNLQRPHKISSPNSSIKESSERDFILVKYHYQTVMIPLMWKFPAQWQLLMRFVDVMNVFIAMWQTLSRRWDYNGVWILTSWNSIFLEKIKSHGNSWGTLSLYLCSISVLRTEMI